MLNNILKEKKISKYKLSKDSGVPYMTVNDLCNGKTHLEKCAAETVFRIAKALQMSTDDLIEPYMHIRVDFALYKSSVCHELKRLGDIEFLVEVLESSEIRRLYERRWYAESLYLLGIVDYVSRENDIPPCAEYDDLRKCSLSEPIYPSGILAIANVSDNPDIIETARKQAIPELARFNIIENEIRDVI